MPSNNNLLVVELNEFSIDFLKIFLNKNKYININKIIKFNKFRYFTKDNVQGENLDPWVQWVSVHTGVESKKHKIYRLGDIPTNKYPQFWEQDFYNDIKIGMWGLMNTSRNKSSSCEFFVPDPWTFSENAYPDELNSFLNIARYSSTNYLKISFISILKLSYNFLILAFKKKIIFKLIYELFFKILPHGIKNGFGNYIFISFYEYLATLLFIKYSIKNNCNMSIIFLNLLAHIQHHYWDDSKKSFIKCSFTVHYLDKILFLLTSNFDNIIIHNGGISQKNTNSEKPWICYRPIDQSVFLNKININFLSVKPLMTHDAHIFFKDIFDLENAYKILDDFKVNNFKIFRLEKNIKEKKLFYTFDFFDELNNDAFFIINNIKYNFFDYFKRIVRRTGRHTNQGSILTNVNIFDDVIFQNHDFSKYIKKYFN